MGNRKFLMTYTCGSRVAYKGARIEPLGDKGMIGDKKVRDGSQYLL